MCIRKHGLEMSRSRVKISKACNWKLSIPAEAGGNEISDGEVWGDRKRAGPQFI